MGVELHAGVIPDQKHLHYSSSPLKFRRWPSTLEAGRADVLAFTVFPKEVWRGQDDPRAVVLDFWESAYEAGSRLAGWAHCPRWPAGSPRH
jgi:hypothetical protein